MKISKASRQQFKKMNQLGQAKVPFLFVIDFEMKKPLVIPIEDLTGDELLYDIQGFRNYSYFTDQHKALALKKYPMAYEQYRESFDIVANNLKYGNSFLVNLTHKTPIDLNLSLLDLFYESGARYKLWLKDQFLVFSPESFVQINEGKIRSFPMKGTIDMDIPDAEKKILEDEKELAEHVTIVDLIRNDLSHVASKVEVKRFRYVEKISTHQKNLLQVSSEIEGSLPKNYAKKIGDILLALLPAGSVSGAPKEKTMEIIQESEAGPRGYYTGIFGYFDGDSLDSGVMIRYIEKTEKGYVFRSGGGITVNSKPEKEYQELIDKVYVPIA